MTVSAMGEECTARYNGNNRYHSCSVTNAQRLAALVDQMRGQDGCWLWSGSLSKGYAQLRIGGKLVYAHCWAYEKVRGPIPEDHELHHTCEHRHCFNPWHVTPLTHKQHVHASPITVAHLHSLKTHCPQGHPYDEANTGPQKLPKGLLARRCRTCNRESVRIVNLAKRGLKQGRVPQRGNRLTAEQKQAIKSQYDAGGASMRWLAKHLHVSETAIKRHIS